MDFLLKFLLYSGQYLTRITAQSIVEAYTRTLVFGRSMNRKYEQIVGLGNSYENILHMYTSNMDELGANGHLAFISDKHKEEFDSYMQKMESTQTDMDEVPDKTPDLSDGKIAVAPSGDHIPYRKNLQRKKATCNKASQSHLTADTSDIPIGNRNETIEKMILDAKKQAEIFFNTYSIPSSSLVSNLPVQTEVLELNQLDKDKFMRAMKKKMPLVSDSLLITSQKHHEITDRGLEDINLFRSIEKYKHDVSSNEFSEKHMKALEKLEKLLEPPTIRVPHIENPTANYLHVFENYPITESQANKLLSESKVSNLKNDDSTMINRDDTKSKSCLMEPCLYFEETLEESIFNTNSMYPASTRQSLEQRLQATVPSDMLVSPNRASLSPLGLEYNWKIDKKDIEERTKLLMMNQQAFDELEASLRVVKIIKGHDSRLRNVVTDKWLKNTTTMKTPNERKLHLAVFGQNEDSFLKSSTKINALIHRKLMATYTSSSNNMSVRFVGTLNESDLENNRCKCNAEGSSSDKLPDGTIECFYPMSTNLRARSIYKRPVLQMAKRRRSINKAIRSKEKLTVSSQKTNSEMIDSASKQKTTYETKATPVLASDIKDTRNNMVPLKTMKTVPIIKKYVPTKKNFIDWKNSKTNTVNMVNMVNNGRVKLYEQKSSPKIEELKTKKCGLNKVTADKSVEPLVHEAETVTKKSGLDNAIPSKSVEHKTEVLKTVAKQCGLNNAIGVKPVEPTTQKTVAVKMITKKNALNNDIRSKTVEPAIDEVLKTATKQCGSNNNIIDKSIEPTIHETDVLKTVTKQCGLKNDIEGKSVESTIHKSDVLKSGTSTEKGSHKINVVSSENIDNKERHAVEMRENNTRRMRIAQLISMLKELESEENEMAQQKNYSGQKSDILYLNENKMNFHRKLIKSYTTTVLNMYGRVLKASHLEDKSVAGKSECKLVALYKDSTSLKVASKAMAVNTVVENSENKWVFFNKANADLYMVANQKSSDKLKSIQNVEKATLNKCNSTEAEVLICSPVRSKSECFIIPKSTFNNIYIGNIKSAETDIKISSGVVSHTHIIRNDEDKRAIRNRRGSKSESKLSHVCNQSNMHRKRTNDKGKSSLRRKQVIRNKCVINSDVVSQSKLHEFVPTDMSFNRQTSTSHIQNKCTRYNTAPKTIKQILNNIFPTHARDVSSRYFVKESKTPVVSQAMMSGSGHVLTKTESSSENINSKFRKLHVKADSLSNDLLSRSIARREKSYLAQFGPKVKEISKDVMGGSKDFHEVSDMYSVKRGNSRMVRSPRADVEPPVEVRQDNMFEDEVKESRQFGDMFFSWISDIRKINGESLRDLGGCNTESTQEAVDEMKEVDDTKECISTILTTECVGDSIKVEATANDGAVKPQSLLNITNDSLNNVVEGDKKTNESLTIIVKNNMSEPLKSISNILSSNLVEKSDTNKKISVIDAVMGSNNISNLVVDAKICNKIEEKLKNNNCELNKETSTNSNINTKPVVKVANSSLSNSNVVEASKIYRQQMEQPMKSKSNTNMYNTFINNLNNKRPVSASNSRNNLKPSVTINGGNKASTDKTMVAANKVDTMKPNIASRYNSVPSKKSVMDLNKGTKAYANKTVIEAKQVDTLKGTAMKSYMATSDSSVPSKKSVMGLNETTKANTSKTHVQANKVDTLKEVVIKSNTATSNSLDPNKDLNEDYKANGSRATLDANKADTPNVETFKLNIAMNNSSNPSTKKAVIDLNEGTKGNVSKTNVEAQEVDTLKDVATKSDMAASNSSAPSKKSVMDFNKATTQNDVDANKVDKLKDEAMKSNMATSNSSVTSKKKSAMDLNKDCKANVSKSVLETNIADTLKFNTAASNSLIPSKKSVPNLFLASNATTNRTRNRSKVVVNEDDKSKAAPIRKNYIMDLLFGIDNTCNLIIPANKDRSTGTSNNVTCNSCDSFMKEPATATTRKTVHVKSSTNITTIKTTVSNDTQQPDTKTLKCNIVWNNSCDTRDKKDLFNTSRTMKPSKSNTEIEPPIKSKSNCFNAYVKDVNKKEYISSTNTKQSKSKTAVGQPIKSESFLVLNANINKKEYITSCNSKSSITSTKRSQSRAALERAMNSKSNLGLTADIKDVNKSKSNINTKLCKSKTAVDKPIVSNMALNADKKDVNKEYVTSSYSNNITSANSKSSITSTKLSQSRAALDRAMNSKTNLGLNADIKDKKEYTTSPSSKSNISSINRSQNRTITSPNSKTNITSTKASQSRDQTNNSKTNLILNADIKDANKERITSPNLQSTTTQPSQSKASVDQPRNSKSNLVLNPDMKDASKTENSSNSNSSITSSGSQQTVFNRVTKAISFADIIAKTMAKISCKATEESGLLLGQHLKGKTQEISGTSDVKALEENQKLNGTVENILEPKVIISGENPKAIKETEEANFGKNDLIMNKDKSILGVSASKTTALILSNVQEVAAVTKMLPPLVPVADIAGEFKEKCTSNNKGMIENISKPKITITEVLERLEVLKTHTIINATNDKTVEDFFPISTGKQKERTKDDILILAADTQLKNKLNKEGSISKADDEHSKDMTKPCMFGVGSTKKPENESKIAVQDVANKLKRGSLALVKPIEVITKNTDNITSKCNVPVDRQSEQETKKTIAPVENLQKTSKSIQDNITVASNTALSYLIGKPRNKENSRTEILESIKSNIRKYELKQKASNKAPPRKVYQTKIVTIIGNTNIRKQPVRCSIDSKIEDVFRSFVETNKRNATVHTHKRQTGYISNQPKRTHVKRIGLETKNRLLKTNKLKPSSKVLRPEHNYSKSTIQTTKTVDKTKSGRISVNVPAKGIHMMVQLGEPNHLTESTAKTKLEARRKLNTARSCDGRLNTHFKPSQTNIQFLKIQNNALTLNRDNKQYHQQTSKYATSGFKLKSATNMLEKPVIRKLEPSNCALSQKLYSPLKLKPTQSSFEINKLHRAKSLHDQHGPSKIVKCDLNIPNPLNANAVIATDEEDILTMSAFKRKTWREKLSKNVHGSVTSTKKSVNESRMFGVGSDTSMKKSVNDSRMFGVGSDTLMNKSVNESLKFSVGSDASMTKPVNESRMFGVGSHASMKKSVNKSRIADVDSKMFTKKSENDSRTFGVGSDISMKKSVNSDTLMKKSVNESRTFGVTSIKNSVNESHMSGVVADILTKKSGNESRMFGVGSNTSTMKPLNESRRSVVGFHTSMKEPVNESRMFGLGSDTSIAKPVNEFESKTSLNHKIFKLEKDGQHKSNTNILKIDSEKLEPVHSKHNEKLDGSKITASKSKKLGSSTFLLNDIITYPKKESQSTADRSNSIDTRQNSRRMIPGIVTQESSAVLKLKTSSNNHIQQLHEPLMHAPADLLKQPSNIFKLHTESSEAVARPRTTVEDNTTDRKPSINAIDSNVHPASKSAVSMLLDTANDQTKRIINEVNRTKVNEILKELNHKKQQDQYVVHKLNVQKHKKNTIDFKKSIQSNALLENERANMFQMSSNLSNIPKPPSEIKNNPVRNNEISTEIEKQGCITHIRNSKGIEFCGPLRVLKNSLWNWDSQGVNQFPVFFKPPTQKNNKEGEQSDAVKDSRRLYRYEKKEVKALLGKPLTVTFLVEDRNKR